MRFLWFGLFAAIFVCSLAASVQPRGFVNSTVYAKQPTSSFTLTDNHASQLLVEINKQRTKAGLEPLSADETLTTTAKQRAQSMITGKFYGHKNPQTGEYYYDILGQQGKRFGYSCENLDLSESDSVQSYIIDWVNSNKGHKECMLEHDVSKIGISIVQTNTFGANQFLVVAIHQE